MAPDAAEARAVVRRWVDAHDGPTEERDDQWFVMFAGEHKHTVGVAISVGDHTLTLQSFFMRAPEEDTAGVYDLLLRRNLRSYTVRFALHPDGDVLLLGVLPLAAVTDEELDRMLGQLLWVADETFDEALRLGFAGYIEREQAWRRSIGQPPNPIT